MVSHPKFYFFDAGVYRTIRPRGPLDSEEETMGAVFETLFYQNLKAINDYFAYEYGLYFWRTASGLEVDFILYGPRGLLAFEVKSGSTIHPKDLNGLQEFCEEYPMARPYIIYGGSREMSLKGIPILPMKKALFHLPELLR